MMTLKPFIKGKYTLVGVIPHYLIGVYFTLQNLPQPLPDTGNGLLFTNAAQWIPSPWISSAVNSLIILLGSILLLRLNNLFSIIPKRTLLPLIFFLLMELASPQFTLLCNGNLIAVVMIALLFPLFFSYHQIQAQSAFLIMGSLSVCTLFCPLIIYYIPLLLLGFLQIRYLNIKSILGGLVGLITPFWILIGLGLLSFENLSQLIPSFSLQIPEAIPYTHPQFWTAVLTAILGAFSGTATIYTTFTEKRQIRSYNGFIALLSVYTALLMLFDYMHYTTYLPLLHVAVSLQAAFFFTHNTKKYGFILFYFVLTLYIALFAWNFLPV